MILKAIIVDDEPKLRKVLEIKLKDKCPEIEVVGTAGNISDAYELIQNKKPVRSEDLVVAVGKAIKRKTEKVLIAHYDVLQHNLKHAGDQNAKIAIPGSRSYDFVRVNDIIRCEGWQKYSRLYLTNKEVIVSSYNLGVYRDLLKSYDFYGCHKSHLINIKHIKKYLREGIVIMSDDSEVSVSRRKKEEFVSLVVKKS